MQEVHESFDRAITHRTLEVAMGPVEPRTCGALRMRAIGVVDGRETIVIEHVTRLAHDVAPDWPTGTGDLSYRVVNAVPYVVAAQPGLLSSVDLPLTIPKHAFVTG